MAYKNHKIWYYKRLKQAFTKTYCLRFSLAWSKTGLVILRFYKKNICNFKIRFQLFLGRSTSLIYFFGRRYFTRHLVATDLIKEKGKRFCPLLLCSRYFDTKYTFVRILFTHFAVTLYGTWNYSLFGEDNKGKLLCISFFCLVPLLSW